MDIAMIVERMWQALDLANDDLHIGVRGDNHTPVRQFRNSYNCPDGTRTTRIPGLSVVYVGYDNITRDKIETAVKRAMMYGEHLYLIEGNSPTDLQYLANDPGERIFTSHRILWRSDQVTESDDHAPR